MVFCRIIWKYRFFILALHPNIKIFETVMLGIKTRRAPIRGNIAENIRSAVARVANGQLNAQEKASVERSKKIREQYEAHWEL